MVCVPPCVLIKLIRLKITSIFKFQLAFGSYIGMNKKTPLVRNKINKIPISI